jgi:dihydroneopterin aldolase
MDKIIMRNMAFFGYHGVLAAEKEQGQTFYIDAILSLDLKKAGLSDDLADTVNYGIIFEQIRKIVEQEKFDLIETLAETLCRDVLLYDVRILTIELTVKKPEAPIPGVFDFMGIQLIREQSDYRPERKSADTQGEKAHA